MPREAPGKRPALGIASLDRKQLAPIPECSQARGEVQSPGAIARRTRAHAPKDTCSRPRPRRGHRHAKAPVLERARQAIGVLMARKAAKLHYPATRRARGAGLAHRRMCGRFRGLQGRIGSRAVLREPRRPGGRCAAPGCRRVLRPSPFRGLRRGRGKPLVGGALRAECQRVRAKRRLRACCRPGANRWRGCTRQRCHPRGLRPDRPR